MSEQKPPTSPQIGLTPQAQAPTTPMPAAVAPDAHAPANVAAEPRPALAPGVELLGKYEGSGFKEPPYLARTAAGQVIQLAPLVYALAEQADGTKTYTEIGRALEKTAGRGLAPEDVGLLIENNLAPLGLVTGKDGTVAQTKAPDPLLGLKFRAKVLPPSVVKAATKLFLPLFWPPVVIAVLVGIVAFDFWLFGSHGVAPSLRQILYQPAWFLAIFGMLILSTAFHELGHATACRYGGGEPGGIGVGLYIVWPAFYADVTDAYRLGRGARLRTDLGGVYFNVIFMLAVAAAYYYTGQEALLVMIVVQHLEIIHQFLPFLRLDGYYVVADIVGVPDLFARIKPILRSLVPWRKSEDKVTELKPWARAVVTVWVLSVVPLLLLNLAVIVVSMPRIMSTGWDSLNVQYATAASSYSAGNEVTAAASALQILILGLPLVGLPLMMARIGKRIASGAWRVTEGRPLWRATTLGASAISIAVAGYILFPWGQYEPIRPEERWTAESAVESLAYIPSGRAGLVLDDPESDPPRVTTRTPARDIIPEPSPSPQPSPATSVDPGVSEPLLEASPSPSPTPSPAPTPTPSPSPSPSPAASPGP